MSLATNIKEFADVLHNIYAQQLSSLEGTDITSDGVLSLAIPKAVVLQQICLYAAKSFSSGVFYFLTFQWLRDFSYLPLISPEIGDRVSMPHDTFLSEPFSYLFSFAKNSGSLSSGVQLQNKAPLCNALQECATTKLDLVRGTSPFNGFLLAGFVNSFFFSFPFSLPHLITLRRMFSQGAAAAAASILGTVAAHSLVIVGVLYGIRFLIVPYYSLQPLTFLIGVVTVAIVITEFVKEKRVYLVPLMDSPSLVRIGVLNFGLALCESATIFYEFHHLTLHQQVSLFELDLLQVQSSALQKVLLEGFFINIAYLLSFVLGHLFFSFGFCYLVLKANERLCSLTGWTIPQTVRRINRTLLVAILALTISCFPYYGLSYLFTNNAGFLPEDSAYRNTVFSPTQVRSRNRHFKTRAPTTKDSRTPLELDLSYFDRGMYLGAPKEEKPTNDLDLAHNSARSETVATYDPVLTFEELNYQGESAWLMRHERARRAPEEQDSKKESVFQKPKTHFKQLRLKQDNKQAEAALKELSQIGSVSEWKEGIRPGERVSLYDERDGLRSSLRFGLGEEDKAYKSKICKDLCMPCNADKTEFCNCKPSRAKVTGSQNSVLLNALHLSESNALENQKQDKTRFFAQEDRSEPDKVVGGSLSYGNSQDRRALLKELSFEKEIASNYEKSFTSPFGEESDGTPPDLLPVENIIKKRYRLNPVYRALLQTDIDSFIARQPADYRITENQEANLFKKRQLLEKYYNSIRYYSPVESVGFTKRYLTGSNEASRRAGESSLQNRAEGGLPLTKSFIETMYHQQFKGTLNTVKRFFKLTFEEQQNQPKNRILSYDQLLYKKRDTFSPPQKESGKGVGSGESRALQGLQSEALDSLHDKSSCKKLCTCNACNASKAKGRGVTPARRSLAKQNKIEESQTLARVQNNEKYHPSLHEELALERVSPFIEESNSAPVYAGWDDKARRFVVTNRFNFLQSSAFLE